jgi:NAD(P)-dependent dehydrogenase (short-subunit alcohol dehydrogenase family)
LHGLYFDSAHWENGTTRGLRTVDFAGDVVLVTGSGAGLGRAYAHLLSRLGARVVVNDVSSAPDGRSLIGGSAQQVVDEITAQGGQAVADAHSVADPEGARAAVSCALDHFGRLDAVINNAGIVRSGGFQRLTPDDIAAVLGVHLIGSILVTREAWKPMLAQGYGRVIFTSSSIGLLGTPGQAAYAGAKGALVGLTRVLAARGAGHGIRVNAVAPMAVTRLNEEVMASIFTTATEQLSPDAVAPVTAFLAHRDCTLTGEVLSAAGGRAARFALGTGPFMSGLDSPEAIRDAMSSLRQTEPARWWSPPREATPIA